MGLFDNVRYEILEEFSNYVKSDNFIYESIGTDGELKCTIFNKRKEPINLKKTSSIIQLLEEKRWGFQITCIRCYSEKLYEGIRGTENYKCAKCGKEFNVFTETILSNAKLPINIYYDTVQMYRNNNKISSLFLASHFKITQKTMWNILNKIKSIPFSLDNDISILSVLLHPPIKKDKIEKSFFYYEKECLLKCKELYKNDSRYFSLIENIFYLLKSEYNEKISALSFALKISNVNMCRYLRGERSIKNEYIKINEFVNSKMLNLAVKQIYKPIKEK